MELRHLLYFIAVADSTFQISTRTESAKPQDERLVLQYSKDASQGASRHGSTRKSTKALSRRGTGPGPRYCRYKVEASA